MVIHPTYPYVTEPLYFEDATSRVFEATVERVLDDAVVLDRTLFYPSGGGQPADTGTLRIDGTEWHVRDVQKRDTIYHHVEPVAVSPERAAGMELDGSPGADSAGVSNGSGINDADADPGGSRDKDVPAALEGKRVEGELDWDRRYAHMRYHTAQHLLSAHLLEAYDAPTTGNQLYADRARLDCRYDRFEERDLVAIEERVNELIEADLPVRWYELERSVAENELDTDRTRIDLLPDSISELRIVEIGSEDDPYDQVACAGTHVESTGDIGTLAITGRATAGSGEERIRFELEP